MEDLIKELFNEVSRRLKKGISFPEGYDITLNKDKSVVFIHNKKEGIEVTLKYQYELFNPIGSVEEDKVQIVLKTLRKE